MSQPAALSPSPEQWLPLSHFYREQALATVFDLGVRTWLLPSIRPAAEHVSASNGPDGGLIERLRKLLAGKQTHGSTEEIGEQLNWDTAKRPPFIALLGHGQPGSFETGDGPSRWTAAKSIAPVNRFYWEQHLCRLSSRAQGVGGLPGHMFDHSGALAIIACCVAEGEAGAVLYSPIRA